jgi:predicted RNase H-like nuclease (RuvC/YqgF family)
LVYALGVAGIAASGALIGAILKMNEQQKTQNAQQREEPQSGQESDQNDHVEYGKLIQTLETKRAHLLGQKIQLETKVRELHEAQRRKAQEEEVQDKLNLSREHSRFRVEK